MMFFPPQANVSSRRHVLCSAVGSLRSDPGRLPRSDIQSEYSQDGGIGETCRWALCSSTLQATLSLWFFLAMGTFPHISLPRRLALTNSLLV